MAPLHLGHHPHRPCPLKRPLAIGMHSSSATRALGLHCNRRHRLCPARRARGLGRRSDGGRRGGRGFGRSLGGGDGLAQQPVGQRAHAGRLHVALWAGPTHLKSTCERLLREGRAAAGGDDGVLEDGASERADQFGRVPARGPGGHPRLGRC
eukprot:scaffold7549_cov111-Isochrysis_galbana.AAC.9